MIAAFWWALFKFIVAWTVPVLIVALLLRHYIPRWKRGCEDEVRRCGKALLVAFWVWMLFWFSKWHGM